jgi:hypothetical protein
MKRKKISLIVPTFFEMDQVSISSKFLPEIFRMRSFLMGKWHLAYCELRFANKAQIRQILTYNFRLFGWRKEVGEIDPKCGK